MAWVGRHITAILGGDLGAFARMWNAPIFAPESGTLAYSEHFVPQTLLALPVTGSAAAPIAAYNTAFMASVWLSALGAYYFVLYADRTPRRRAGRRHPLRLQHLSPDFALAPPHLVGAVGAVRADRHPGVRADRIALGAGGRRQWSWVALALSSVYYLAYFTPVIALFGGVALSAHRLAHAPGAIARR